MPKAGRNADGTFDGTRPPRNGGRRALPWDLLDGHVETAWAMLVACATGEVMPTAKGNKAVAEMAQGADLEMRKEAANELLDRVHGKAQAVAEVDVSSTTREIREVRVLVVGADPKQVGSAIDVLPATTTTH